MDVERTVRPVATICIVATALGVIYSAAGAVTDWNPAAGPVLQALLHLAVLVLIVATAASGAGGRGWAARIGFGAGALGFALLAVAEIVYPFSADAGDQIFNVAPLIAGVGLIVAGVAVLTHRAWEGWHRVVLLVAGAWTFVGLAPALVLSGGPPAPVALWAIAGWELLFTLTAVALRSQTSARRRVPAVA